MKLRKQKKRDDLNRIRDGEEPLGKKKYIYFLYPKKKLTFEEEWDHLKENGALEFINKKKTKKKKYNLVRRQKTVSN